MDHGVRPHGVDVLSAEVGGGQEAVVKERNHAQQGGRHNRIGPF